jgi:hypothetical protein
MVNLQMHENCFYTYAYLREDKTPYYIGKGKGQRAFVKLKNEIPKPKYKDRIIILKNNLTEEERKKYFAPKSDSIKQDYK